MGTNDPPPPRLRRPRALISFATKPSRHRRRNVRKRARAGSKRSSDPFSNARAKNSCVRSAASSRSRCHLIRTYLYTGRQYADTSASKATRRMPMSGLAMSATTEWRVAGNDPTTIGDGNDEGGQGHAAGGHRGGGDGGG